MTSSEEDSAGRPTWAANSGWSGPQNLSSSSGAGGQNRYRRNDQVERESPPVEISQNDTGSDSEPHSKEDLVLQEESANPVVETESTVEEPKTQEQIWRETLLKAGGERLEELADRLISLGGEIQGDRAYVTRVAEGVMAHVTVSVKLRKG